MIQKRRRNLLGTDKRLQFGDSAAELATFVSKLPVPLKLNMREIKKTRVKSL